MRCTRAHITVFSGWAVGAVWWEHNLKQSSIFSTSALYCHCATTQRQINHTFIANTPKCSGVNGCKSTLFCHIHCSLRRGVVSWRHLTEGAAGKFRFIKASNFCCHIVLRHVLPRPVRGDSPCGGCWGCSPQRYLLDVASSRTLTVRPQQGLRRLA